MEVKLIWEKDNQTVILYECRKFIQGELKNFYIKENNQYFVNEKRAIRAANDLLLKKTLPKWRYLERQEEKKKRIGAEKVIYIYDCYKDTKAYIKRWDGILYLETKKRLLAELKEKLSEVCNKYGFKNAHAAIGFIKRIKNSKQTK